MAGGVSAGNLRGFYCSWKPLRFPAHFETKKHGALKVPIPIGSNDCHLTLGIPLSLYLQDFPFDLAFYRGKSMRLRFDLG